MESCYHQPQCKENTRYYIDEFHLLLKEEQTAAYSVEIWKRFRKWGGIPTGITQNIKDLLASREIENIFENSDFIYLKQGDIKVIMVKDLSRLGRDYIGVGDYIEQIFPLMGVRFIAVNNSFDSMKLNNGTPGIEVAVSNLVNNMYSRDIAKRFGLLWKRTGRTGKPPARMSLWICVEQERWAAVGD